jgi:hypothetical protein
VKKGTAPRTTQVFLVDTLSELPLFYAVANVAFVGGVRGGYLDEMARAPALRRRDHQHSTLDIGRRGYHRWAPRVAGILQTNAMIFRANID